MTTPTLKSKSSIGNLGDPHTGLPEVYTRGNFEETALKQKYGVQPSRKEQKQFKRYLNSDAGVAAKNSWLKSENEKELASYNEYAKALSAKSQARVQAVKDAFYKDFPKWNDSEESTLSQPVSKLTPTITPRSDAEWNRIASEATNGQLKTMADVKKWQANNGFTGDAIDGKFGKNSLAKWNALKSNSAASSSANPAVSATSELVSKTAPTLPRASSGTPDLTQSSVTEQSSPFNFDAFVKGEGLNTVVKDGKRYAHYDPNRLGDFYIDESGNVFRRGFDHSVDIAYTKNTKVASTKLRENLNNLFQMIGNYKQGGTMNRINYFQQGGAAPQQGNVQEQVIALVQAAMQGDQKATQTVNQIMEAAKAGDQQAVQLAQMIQKVAQKMQGQVTAAKWGSKLEYIKRLKYAKGGKTCPECEKAEIEKSTKKPVKKVDEKACGGKARKHYFGGKFV